jgi:excisionase family DNA binding protein
MSDSKLAYSVRSAAQAMGLSTKTIDRLVKAGQIEVARVGRRVLIPSASLERLLQDNTISRGKSDETIP